MYLPTEIQNFKAMGWMLTRILCSLHPKWLVREISHSSASSVADKVSLSSTFASFALSSTMLTLTAVNSACSFKCSKMQLLSRMTYQQYAYYCTATESTVVKRTRSRTKNHVSSLSSDDIDEEVSTSDKQVVFEKSLSIDALKTSLKKVKKQSYVFEARIAEKLVKTILAHRTHPHAPMLEIGAGPGVVSKEFLKQGVSRVVALETNTDFSHLLLALQKRAGADRYQVFNWQMVNIYIKLHSSQHSKRLKAYQETESLVAEALLPSSSPHDDAPHSIFSVGGSDENDNFAYFIVRNLPHEDAILSHGRVEFFYLVHPRFKAKIDHLGSIKKREDCHRIVSAKSRTQALRFHYVHSMLYLFYEFEVIEQFEADDFYPPFNPAKRKQSRGIDPTKRLLVRLRLKENISEILPLEQHTLFLNFLRQLYKKKLTRIIPTMEILVPGCGLRLIAEEFTMLDNIVVSRPEDLLRIFKMMLKWPEYKTSPLHNYLMMSTMGSAEEEEEMFGADKEED